MSRIWYGVINCELSGAGVSDAFFGINMENVFLIC